MEARLPKPMRDLLDAKEDLVRAYNGPKEIQAEEQYVTILKKHLDEVFRA